MNFHQFKFIEPSVVTCIFNHTNMMCRFIRHVINRTLRTFFRTIFTAAESFLITRIAKRTWTAFSTTLIPAIKILNCSPVTLMIIWIIFELSQLNQSNVLTNVVLMYVFSFPQIFLWIINSYYREWPQTFLQRCSKKWKSHFAVSDQSNKNERINDMRFY